MNHRWTQMNTDREGSCVIPYPCSSVSICGSSLIRYGSVWEDADILCEALAPVARGGRLLSIASAGDNALALLTLDPKEVVVVDRNPAQLACLELRCAAFRRLEYAQMLAFLGVNHAQDRPA